MSTIQNMSKTGKWLCTKCSTWNMDQAYQCSWCGAKKPKAIKEEPKVEKQQDKKNIKDISPYMVLGWAWSEACSLLDKGDDPRTKEIPKIKEQFEKDFGIK